MGKRIFLIGALLILLAFGIGTCVPAAMPGERHSDATAISAEATEGSHTIEEAKKAGAPAFLNRLYIDGAASGAAASADRGAEGTGGEGESTLYEQEPNNCITTAGGYNSPQTLSCGDTLYGNMETTDTSGRCIYTQDNYGNKDYLEDLYALSISQYGSYTISVSFSTADIDLYIMTPPATTINPLCGQYYCGLSCNNPETVTLNLNPGTYIIGVNLYTLANPCLAAANATYTLSVTGSCSSTCTVTCNSAVPSTANVGSPVSFIDNSQIVGDCGIPCFFPCQWDFGDGSSDWNNCDTNHTYTSAGTYHWTFSRCWSGDSCGDSGTIVVGGGGGTCSSASLTQVDMGSCPTVTTYVSVLDSNGHPVTGLGQSSFRPKEGGVAQSITCFDVISSGGNLAVGISVDGSGSLSSSDWSAEQSAVVSFVNLMGAGQKAAIWVFGSSVSMIKDFTTDHQALISAMQGTAKPGGNTALYDSIYASLTRTGQQTGPKGVIAMTDGKENNSSHSQSDVINHALSLGIPIYTIGFGSADATELQELASQSHGKYYAAGTSSNLQAIISDINQNIQNQYKVCFQTSKCGTNQVQVDVNCGGNWISSNSQSVSYPTSCPGCGTSSCTVKVGQVTACGSPCGTLQVPIEMISTGNVNSVSFSVSFSTSVLSCGTYTKGADAQSATVTENRGQCSSGRWGFLIGLPGGSAFPSGTRQLLVISFGVACGTTATSADISFADSPISKEVADTYANVVSAQWAGGSGCLVPPCSGYEGDVSPWPAGDSRLSATDYAKMARCVAGLDDCKVDGCACQKADQNSYSSGTYGDGRISAADYAQSARYVAALDPMKTVAGPTCTAYAFSDDGPEIVMGEESAAPEAARAISVPGATITRGQSGPVKVNLESQGDENSIGFSLTFDTSLLTFVSADKGSGASQATLTVNDAKKGEGKVGILLGLPGGQAFTAGTREILSATFQAAAGAGTATTTVGFGDDPIYKEVSDTQANIVTAAFNGGTVTLQGQQQCDLTCAATVPGSGSAGQAISFSSSATPVNCTGSPAFAWTFGDGGTSSSQNPSHTYSAAGQYNWTLTVTADGITCTKSGTISIGQNCTLSCNPSASPTSGVAPLSVTFAANVQSTGCSGSPSYSWNFGDGASSNQQNPSHSYGSAGTYSWSFSANQAGQSCSKSGSVVVVPPGDQVTFSLGSISGSSGQVAKVPMSLSHGQNKVYAAGFDVSFDISKLELNDVVTGTKHDYGVELAQGLKDMGFTVTANLISSGTVRFGILNLTNPTAVPDGVVCYIRLTPKSGVTGTVIISNICSASDTHGSDLVSVCANGSISIGSCTLSCSASANPNSGNAPLTVQFNASASASGCGGTTSYAWTFGDGQTSSQQSPSHTYASQGSFTWKVVASNGGQSCEKSGTVLVTQAPVCTITSCAATVSPATGNAPLTANFSSSVSTSNCTGNPTYLWNFGDGSTSAQQNASHTYALAGAYNWTFQVSVGNQTCTKTGTVTVTVVPPVVTGVSHLAGPFRLVISGSNFQPNMQVFLAGQSYPWANIKLFPTQVKVKGAKAYFPKDGSETTVKLVNGDGGQVTVGYNKTTRSWRIIP